MKLRFKIVIHLIISMVCVCVLRETVTTVVSNSQGSSKHIHQDNTSRTTSYGDCNCKRAHTVCAIERISYTCNRHQKWNMKRKTQWREKRVPLSEILTIRSFLFNHKINHFIYCESKQE